MFEMGAECLCEEILVVQVGGCRGWRSQEKYCTYF